MGHRKTAIFILTILLVAAALFSAVQEADGEVPFSFAAVTEAGSETIHFWQQNDGAGFVFLPSYVDLEDLQIHCNRPIFLDDVKFRYGQSCGSLQLDHPYTLSGPSGSPETLTFLRSGNMPTLFIDTASGSMETVHAEKGIEEAGYLRLYTPDGGLDHWGRLEFIKTRGNGTFFQPKKPYSLKLASDGDLLGMGAASKWILLANALDESQIKNKFSLDFAAAAGLPFTPETRWVDLYLNGEYAGLYLLSERNEIHPQRVALEEGFLFTQDYYERLAAQGLPHFLTEAEVPVRIYQTTWPEDEMHAFVQSAENAILASDGVDPVTGKHWTDLIDLDSWARKYLLEEILGGGDAGFLSQFYHFRGSGPHGKLYAGPAWDYDYTMGIDRYWDTVPNMFYAHRKASSPWFHALYGKEEFYRYMTRLFETEIHPLLETFLDERFPAYAAQIAQAARLEEIRWQEAVSAETQRELAYMRQRVEFLEDVWIRGGDYVELTTVSAGSAIQFALNYAIPRGETPPAFLAEKPWDWFVYGTDEPYDITQPLLEDRTVYAVKHPQPELEKEERPAPQPESRKNWELRLPLYGIALLMAGLFAVDLHRAWSRKKREQHHVKV